MSGRRRKLVEVFSAFADVASLQGIPFIKKSNNWWSTTFWYLAFTGATVLAFYQLYYVIDNFLQKQYSTVIELGFGQLDFPSVTVCNLNSVRVTAAQMEAPQLDAFFRSLHPTNNNGDNSQNGGSQTQSGGSQTQNGGSQLQNSSPLPKNAIPRQKSLIATHAPQTSEGSTTLHPKSSESPTPHGLAKVIHSF